MKLSLGHMQTIRCQVEFYPASNHKDLEANIGEVIVHGAVTLIRRVLAR